MKKAVLLFCLFLLSGCATDYDPVVSFQAYTSADEMEEGDETLVALTKSDSVAFNYHLEALENFFELIGWKIVKDRKEAKYGFDLKIARSSTPYLYSQPVWGEKNIDRTRANSYGGYDVFYNYGVVGYRQRTVYQNETTLYLKIKRLRDNKPIFDVILKAFSNTSDGLMVSNTLEGVLQSGIKYGEQNAVQFNMKCKDTPDREGFFCKKIK